MTPGIQAEDDVEGAGRKLGDMDVGEPERHQMSEPVVARPRLGLRVADGGDVYPEDAAPQLARQAAHRAAEDNPPARSAS